MQITWHEDAWNDCVWWQSQHKKKLRRINSLIKEMQRTTFDGIGKPEPLKENLSGWWSRRIEETNHIVWLFEIDSLLLNQYSGMINSIYTSLLLK